MLVGGDRIPHQDLFTRRVVDEYQAMAASEEREGVAVAAELQREAPGRDTIGGLQSRQEGELASAKAYVKEAE